MANATWPPGPKGPPFVGSLLALRRDYLGFLLESARLYGDMVHFRAGPYHAFLLVHPDLVRDVLITHQHSFMKGRGIQWARRFLGEGLLTSEGALHTRQRRLCQPAFHPERIQAYGRIMADYAVRTRERWSKGGVVEVSQEMTALTMAVVAKALFDADVEQEAAELGESLSVIVRLFARFNLPLSGLLQLLPLPSNLRFRRARARLDATIFRIIAERRSSGEDRGDLLSMLLLAQDVEGDGSGMSDLQLRDEAMTLFLAGHETTANALTWTFYLLSQNPDAEARLHHELDQALAGRPPSVEDIPCLRYTEWVFAESMRLYPPAWSLGRRALRDQPLGGYVIPAGSYVMLSPYVTHRDPRFFPEPTRFDPERWRPEARAARPKFSYFPFGGGARQCIGEPFAWMEGVLILATLCQRFRLRLVPGHPVEPQPLITLRPRHGMRMTVASR